MGTKQVTVIDSRRITLTNIEKKLWPQDGLTKAHLIKYYTDVAPYMLPHLQGRPLTLTRYPNGINSKFFYQKQCPAYAPDWIRTYQVASNTGDIDYILAEERACLTWLANQAVIEIHPWLSQIDNPQCPSQVIIDLDPAEGCTFSDVVLVAFLVKELLDQLQLVSHVKTSGATGLHIYVGLALQYSYKVTSSFVAYIGQLLVKTIPDKVTTERLVKNRTGRVYVDHLQNLPGKTIVAPYSVRPRPMAPVSTPILWRELNSIVPNQFTVTTVLPRLIRTGDLFAPLVEERQTIDHIIPLFRHLLA
ncbi:MAG: non-homologous end-joining DNA ligase [Limnochordia bacterium]|nr:non-homologous end-joining DNA ligase [Limnochordia bacterium]MDD4517036.1 non-homologous end-joining DNA ligase [Limnochordia bacterium]